MPVVPDPSMAPLVLYAIFGTSRALAVRPVAVASLMTAAANGELAATGSPAYWPAAMTLALLSGLMLVAMGLLRLGFLANFLSHPVISGFISASGILIALSQPKTLLGVKAGGHTVREMLGSLLPQLGGSSGLTLAIGVGATAFLWWVRKGLKPLLRRVGLGPRQADLLAKAGPVMAIAVAPSVVIAAEVVPPVAVREPVVNCLMD